MTKEQYRTISESFYKYSECWVEYETYIPSCDKYTKTNGWLHGIGQGHNNETLIIAYLGYSNAIHYSMVKFPKKIVRQ